MVLLSYRVFPTIRIVKEYTCIIISISTSWTFPCNFNRMGGVMVNMLASSVVDRGFQPWSGQTKDYKIGICCFSAKRESSRSYSKDWFARNRGSVSEWGNMSIRGLLFQWKSDLIVILLKINLFSPWYSWKIVELALSNNHSLHVIININILNLQQMLEVDLKSVL